MRRFSLLFALLLMPARPVGCHGSNRGNAVAWHDLATGGAAARAQKKPAAVFFGATWNGLSTELRTKMIADPEVRELLEDRFIAIDVDCTDSDSPGVDEVKARFNVTGVPALLILAPDLTTELRRVNAYAEPATIAAALRAAS